MGNSLQDQLLKAGLVKQQQLKQAKSSKRKQQLQRGKGKADPAEEQRRLEAEKAQAQKAERDRELNRQRNEEARLKALENEVRQLIHENRLVRDRAEIAFNFTDGTALKRLYVTADQQRGLVGGKLALVRQDAFYELVDAEVAGKIRERDASRILVQNAASDEEEADDDYAEYKVPDDLIW